MKTEIMRSLRALSVALKNTPFFGPLLKEIGMRIILRKRYRNEIALLAGRHKNLNTHQSIMFFTAQKCASVYVGNILKRIVSEAGITPIDFASYFWDFGDPSAALYQAEKILHKGYKAQGYFYGPFRKWVPSLKGLINDYKVMLMLRDPRDVLVSYYYSIAYSHKVPYHNRRASQRLLADRKKALNMTIDGFVLETSGIFEEVYQKYCEELLGKRNVLFAKYENMVYDFKEWLARILEFLDIQAKQETVDTMVNAAALSAKEENMTAHKRIITPGDHKVKLKSDTIANLNLKYKDILEQLGYTIEA